MARKSHAKALRSQHWFQPHSLSTTKTNYFQLWAHQLYLRMWAANLNSNQYRTTRRTKNKKLGNSLKEGPIYIRSGTNQTVVCSWVNKLDKKSFRKFKK